MIASKTNLNCCSFIESMDRNACSLMADRNLKKLVRCSGKTESEALIMFKVGSKISIKIGLMKVDTSSPSLVMIATVQLMTSGSRASGMLAALTFPPP